MNESVLSIACGGEPLVGILAEPDGTPADVGVLIIVGGPQYRVGSHRQFTLLARNLAGNGFAALRFDYRSMGDSPGETRDFLDVGTDIAAAIDALLAARPALRRVVLWGLCDAASASLLYLDATHDPRVAGVALLNPWVRSAATLAQTHVKHYYWRRLRQPEFWLKLLRGGVGLAALRGLGSNLRLARGAGQAKADSRSFQDRMAAGLRGFAGPALLILSGDDYTAREFAGHARTSTAWLGLLTRPTLDLHELPTADHTFSMTADHGALCRICLDWMRTRCLTAESR
ncbi:hydrolase 1, exosortase A system-associated [Roseateles saccharophilus]|uniref:Exosortase A-associated hydrolase 1 n=1 Tax=Roseateles saccharophilus TaxID=304 RepID=A0A4R3UEU2_ROSSA|nr:hydrolase 1, exosortase A system-associated [Roseateles saccharophilus]MDG0835173.1 hydrolase 1, exosortase A system-associated [Roseateles saccharophilus]TCU87814.1 exosortase A-associated hydrolase 1 [Roseateles saccharophilus]